MRAALENLSGLVAVLVVEFDALGLLASTVEGVALVVVVVLLLEQEVLAGFFEAGVFRVVATGILPFLADGADEFSLVVGGFAAVTGYVTPFC